MNGKWNPCTRRKRGRTHLQRESVAASRSGVLDDCCFPLFTFLCFPGSQHWACVTFIGKINLSLDKLKTHKAISIAKVCLRHKLHPIPTWRVPWDQPGITETKRKAPRPREDRGRGPGTSSGGLWVVGRGVNCYDFLSALFAINQHACLLWWQK